MGGGGFLLSLLFICMFNFALFGCVINFVCLILLCLIFLISFFLFSVFNLFVLFRFVRLFVDFVKRVWN